MVTLFCSYLPVSLLKTFLLVSITSFSPKNKGNQWVNFSFESECLTFYLMKALIDSRSRVGVINRISPVRGSLEMDTPIPRLVSLTLSLVWKQVRSSARSSSGVLTIKNWSRSFSLLLKGGYGLMGPWWLHSGCTHLKLFASLTASLHVILAIFN